MPLAGCPESPSICSCIPRLFWGVRSGPASPRYNAVPRKYRPDVAAARLEEPQPLPGEIPSRSASESASEAHPMLLSLQARERRHPTAVRELWEMWSQRKSTLNNTAGKLSAYRAVGNRAAAGTKCIAETLD